MDKETKTHERKKSQGKNATVYPALLLVHPFSYAIPIPRKEPLGRLFLEGLPALSAFVKKMEEEATWEEALSSVSRRHAQFSFDKEGSCWVKDLGSKNGTYIQGKELSGEEQVCVGPWSLLRFGELLFFYHPGLEEELFGEGSAPMGEMIGPWGLQEQKKELAILAARPQKSVLLLGASGTGKELFAKEIAGRLRSKKSCSFWNIAAGPETTFEAQLFGHERGAFTGADKPSLGVIRSAEGGVVVLDEIGELPPDLQAKLLRFLENGEVQPVGATAPVKVDVLCVLSTHRNLRELVKEGKFREDLLARIEFPCISLPSLDARRGDLLAIARSLLGKMQCKAQLSADAAEFLALRAWPRNIRQLRSVLAQSLDAHGMVDMDRLIGASQISARDPSVQAENVDSSSPNIQKNSNESSKARSPLPETLEEILRGLQAHGGVIERYANFLGWSKGGFVAHCKKKGFWDDIPKMKAGRPKTTSRMP